MKIYTTEELDNSNQIAFPYVEKQMVGGLDILLYVDNYRSEDWYGYRGWLRKLKDSERAKRLLATSHCGILEKIKSGDTVFDCGANEGYITTLIAKKVGPTGKVLAFEPVKKNIEVMRKNLELNELSNVTIIDKVISNKSGEKVWFSAEVVQNVTAGVEIETVCLDNYLHYKPNFIKIDVEGYELPVLQGATRILEEGPLIMIEMHLSDGTGIHMKKKFGFDPNNIITLMHQNDYSMKYAGKEVSFGDEPPGCVYCTKLIGRTSG